MKKLLNKSRFFPVIGILALSIGLAAASNTFESIAGWFSFAIILILAGSLLWGGFWLLRQEPIPKWLSQLTLGACLLRLTAGVLWVLALPVLGYGSEVQQAGYIMDDAKILIPDRENLVAQAELLISGYIEFDDNGFHITQEGYETAILYLKKLKFGNLKII